MRLTHGLSKCRLYQTWEGMIQRCYNKKSTNYHRYGGIGVTMCDDWKNNFKNFYDWCIENGWRQGLEIDKDIIPKKLNIPALIYSPEMCSIVTHKANSKCRASSFNIEFNGVTKCLREWALDIGVKDNTLLKRLSKWSKEKALTTPCNQQYKTRVKQYAN